MRAAFGRLDAILDAPRDRLAEAYLAVKAGLGID